ncbi:MAG TPA: chemotaxis response regulator protein-glutamate methylesterase [Polyangiaceae bacterium]|nr:chemotaxis response regulator protein-glutamate methylesterase [Polyangiaceae bacterium]
MTTASFPPIRVLVVDDSVFNRRSISEILGASPGIEVVGKAADGEEALRLVGALKPDAITLDLEMPRMDGFTFLRILMTKMPTPVIVVSSYSQKENVFKALELGALDFVAKPDRYSDPDLGGIRDELVRKVLLARSVRRLAPPLQRRAPDPSVAQPAEARPDAPLPQPKQVVAIASSTGGPSALMEIFGRLPPNYAHGIVIAQHMPDKFTRTFAERLDRRSQLRVGEAADRDSLTAGSAFVCPGRHCMELESMTRSGLRLRVSAPAELDRYVPSADRLLLSVARAVGKRAVGVILTGMGDDGVQGAKAIFEAGGVVVAEAESTAVVYGMPGSAVRAGVTTLSLPLTEIADFIARL